MIDVPLPSLGPDMQAGKLLEWRIAPGQAITKGTIIAVVDTEKAAIDVESWHDGTVIELLADPGQELAVGTVIARLAAPGEVVPPTGAPPAVTDRASDSRPLADSSLAATPPSAPQVSGPAPAPAAAATVRASPAARARARALNVQLETVASRRPDGVVTLEDVEAAATVAAKSGAPASSGDRQASVRAAIAAAMVRSNREIPHYYLWDDVDVSRVMQWLAAANAQRPVTARLLPAALLLSAVARAASEFADMNGQYDGDAYHGSASVHLGVAVALRGGGLIAPALRDAQSLGAEALMRQLSDLVARARRGGLRSSEVTGQSLTVTHLGEAGCRGLLGVIHPPQVALVGIGRIGERAVIIDGTIVARPCVTISLAADHRVSDGRRGAQFLARIGALLQQPEIL